MVNKIENLVVDTTAFIKNAPLHEIANNILTVQEVVDEITNKRQLRRLIVLPYDLTIKDVFSENIQHVTDFAKKTGDYPSLSATDIKVMALTYQLEKEKVGTAHLKQEPIAAPTLILGCGKPENETPTNLTGFFLPNRQEELNIATQNEQEEIDKEINKELANLELDDVLATITSDDDDDDDDASESESDDNYVSESDSDDDEKGWIKPNNIDAAKRQMHTDLVEDKSAVVACITTDFAMQNVLKQMGLNVTALDGRLIKQLRTFILRCHTCFKTTSLMEKIFCPKCGNKTLKKVAVSLDADGKQHIHINARRPLTARGKKFSLPTFKGGKHANNPILSEDQPRPKQRVSNQARLKNNPLDPDYIAGYSPFVMRDVNSRSALLGVRSSGVELKYWMKKNPNENRRRRKK